MNELNKRQKTFAEAYAIPGTDMYGNATKSAISAGYKESRAEVTGSELVRNSKVQEYIRTVEEQLFDENIMSGKEVLYHLTKTARAESKEIEPMIVKTGTYKENPTTGKQQLVYDEKVELVPRDPKMSDRNKALELLGKHHRLFTDKVEAEVNTPIFVNDVPEDD
ncbi:terminase small subunit [Staphylococcus saprophyticus]|uniref:terminase small subunit n=1 Tax=Staphylococcus saprophyticus TaxID=29385 RepID=UPI0011A6A2FA|nr:terminase small subunit [Staphylococcus saprophyticus]MDW4355197.1 terminase small subunit [Staphylococcus saprophyticus]